MAVDNMAKFQRLLAIRHFQKPQTSTSLNDTAGQSVGRSLAGPATNLIGALHLQACEVEELQVTRAKLEAISTALDTPKQVVEVVDEVCAGSWEQVEVTGLQLSVRFRVYACGDRGPDMSRT